MKPFKTETLSVPTNGIRLHVEAAGPAGGPLVILLHGFPEYWAGFQAQIGPLAQAGLRVVAPDQRGYNLSDKPAGVAAYRLDTLAHDILGLLDFFGREKAILIGHDWGAEVAWQLGISYPQRVERLGILNVPHPGALRRAFSHLVWRQVVKSWYIYFFQIPALPEFLLRLGHYAPMRAALRAAANPGTFSKADLRRYTAAWAQPGAHIPALSGMLNWYRAALRPASLRNLFQPGQAQNAQQVQAPTLILWGKRDVALIPELAQWSLEYCPRGRLVYFPRASHFLQHDEPEQVTQELLNWIPAEED